MTAPLTTRRPAATPAVKLTRTQLLTLSYYQTGVWPAGLQSNHKIAAERVLRYNGLLEMDGMRERLTDAGRAFQIAS